METTESYDAATALRDAQSARDRVATRVAAPPYYYPALGLLTGFMVAAEAVNVMFGSMACMALAVGSGSLLNRYQEKTGMGTRLRGPAARSFLWAQVGYIVTFVILAGASVWVQLSHHPAWWGLPLGLLAAFVATIVLGKVYEPWMRQRIRTGDATPNSIR